MDAFNDTRIAVFGRTTTSRDIYFDFDLGVESFISYVSLLGHNLSQFATITISANSSPDLDNAVAIYTGTWTVKNIIQEVSDIDYESGWFNIIGPDSGTDYNLTDESGNQIVGNIYSTGYRYWRIYIDDEYNTDGYLEISKIYIGSSLTLPYMGKNQKLPTASTGIVAFSPTGQAYGDKGIEYKYATINFPYVTDAQKLQVDTAFSVVGKTVPFINMIWENDLDFQPPLYSILTTDLDWTRLEGITGRFWSLAFSFREVY